MKKKVAIVTGANAGIGKETAIELAKLGYHVHIVCRNEKRGNLALEEILEIKDAEASLSIVDLSDFKEVKIFAQEFHYQFNRIDVLIHNAGVISKDRVVNEDGIELQLAVHHLGPMLMNHYLLPLINNTQNARIIHLSSVAHKWGRVNFNDLQMEKNYQQMLSYGRSKLCNLLYVKQLAKKLENTTTTVNCVHPGAVATNIMSNKKNNSIFQKFALKFIKTPFEGAQTSLYVATSADCDHINGKYFADSTIKKTSRTAQNEQLAIKLWEVSEELLKDYL